MSSWKYLPPTSELAARVRDGETLKEVARSVGMEPQGLVHRLLGAGFMATGETERDYRRREMKAHLRTKLLRWVEPWMEQAACASVDPELWYPERGGNNLEARRICAGCAVVGECREYALRNKERYGLWGNTSEKDRRKILKGDAA